MLDPYTRKLLSQYAFQQQHAAAANGYPPPTPPHPHPQPPPPPMLGAPPDFPPSTTPPGPPFPPTSGFPALPPIPPPAMPHPLHRPPGGDPPFFPPFPVSGGEGGDRSPSPTAASAVATELPAVKRRSPITAGGGGGARGSGFTIDSIIGNNNNKDVPGEEMGDVEEEEERFRRQGQGETRASRDRSRSPIARRSVSPPPSPRAMSEVKSEIKREESSQEIGRVPHPLLRRRYLLHPDLVEASAADDEIVSDHRLDREGEGASPPPPLPSPPRLPPPALLPPTPPKNVISALYQSLQQQWAAP